MKTSINIPDNLNEIKLFDYQQFLNIKEPTEKDVLKTFLYMNDNIINRMKKSKVQEISQHITKLFENKPQLTSIFEHKGVKYGFIPSLDNISWGENADVNEYIGDWETMHLAMSVLYRPITTQKKNKYLIEDYDGTNKDLIEMPLGVVLGATLFFYHLTNDLLNYIPNYLVQQVEKETNQKLEMSLVENGGTTTSYTHSLKEILQNLKKLQENPYMNVTYT